MKKYWMAFALLVVAVTAMPAQDTGHDHAWSYEGENGPAHWGDLEPAFSACKVGKEQSPIDIRNATEAKLPAIHFEYKNSSLKIINNGHTIQVNYDPGSFITVGDKKYQLIQFHFHRPSEERIHGRSYEMVAHLVHADSSGKLAVVGVLLEKGTANDTVNEVWAHMPKTEGKQQEFPGVQVNAAGLLPEKTAYYTYAGSLTTPPCSEGVTWLVLKSPTQISAEQIETFAKIYPMNSRPIQPLNGRVVKDSE
jgi:carbonic anhydrase